MAIPKDITKEHVLKALTDLDANIPHLFGPPTKYQVLHNGKRYASKAVVGFAAKHLKGVILTPDEFSSGWAPGQACYVLDRLGFKIVDIEGLEEDDSTPPDWSDQEASLVVADYFQMMRSELLQEQYNKTAHRRQLRKQLDSRTDGSIEFKHQNISAALVSMGLPYIKGYKPRCNYQHILLDEIVEYIRDNPRYFDSLINAPVIDPQQEPSHMSSTLDDLFVPPPDLIETPSQHQKPWLTRRATKIDFAKRDAKNRRLGKLGEKFAFGVEKRRLSDIGRKDLAKKIEWVSDSIGDGLGYDILSFNETDESERLIEVKTTGLGRFFPFYVSRTELRCSEDMSQAYHLYRVFEYSTSPKLFVLEGALSKSCHLEPTQYQARAGQTNT